MSWRLVGYSATRELGRVRVYVEAELSMTGRSEVFVAPMTAPFDYRGQPLRLQRASSAITARVRAHLLGQKVPAHVAAVQFEPI